MYPFVGTDILGGPLVRHAANYIGTVRRSVPTAIKNFFLKPREQSVTARRLKKHNSRICEMQK